MGTVDKSRLTSNFWINSRIPALSPVRYLGGAELMAECVMITGRNGDFDMLMECCVGKRKGY